MRTIPFYVTWQLLKLFCMVLFVITVFMILFGVGKQVKEANLGVGPVLRIIPFLLPNALMFAVPGTILYTVCTVYGNMSADNEVVALKSLGIAPTVVLWPAFVIAFVLSLLCVWLNDVAYSWGMVGMQRVVVQSLEEIAYGMLKSQHSFSSPKFSIIVKAVEDRRLMRPIMTFQTSGDVPSFTLTADEAILTSNLEKNVLNLELKNCEIESGRGMRMSFPGRLVREIPLDYLSPTDDGGSGSPKYLPLTRIATEVGAQERRIRDLEQALAAEAAWEMMTGDLAELHTGLWNMRRAALGSAKDRLTRLRTEPWRRTAGGFSCLAFVLVGAPLAILRKNADYLNTFAVSFLPVLLVYYPLTYEGLNRAKDGVWPPASMWIGNLLWFAVGALLVRRIRR